MICATEWLTRALPVPPITFDRRHEKWSREVSSGEFQVYWRALTRWAVVIVLTTLIGAAVGYAVARVTPAAYRSTVTLLINQQQNPVALDYNQVLLSESLARTYSELIRTRPIIEDAIREA